MKLISRKAFLAGATALSVTLAGTTVATAAENADTAAQVSSATSTGAPSQKIDSDANKQNNAKKAQDLSSKDANPESVKAWIEVITAAVGALGTLFAFANKYINIDDLLKNFKLPF